MSTSDYQEFFTEEKNASSEWFKNEISSLRTGRVKPDLIETTQVEHYGSRSPLKSLAGVSNTDARTLLITPWDPGAKESIAKALTDADLGANPSVDGDVIRLVFPSLTEESRDQVIKMLHKKAEEVRVRMRQARDEALKMVKEAKESGDLTEDDFYEEREMLDKAIGAANGEIEALMAKKEEDIKEI